MRNDDFANLQGLFHETFRGCTEEEEKDKRAAGDDGGGGGGSGGKRRGRMPGEEEEDDDRFAFADEDDYDVPQARDQVGEAGGNPVGSAVLTVASVALALGTLSAAPP